MAPNAVLSAPLTVCVLHVFMTHEKRVRRNFHLVRYKNLRQQLISYTTVVYIKMLRQSKVQVCAHFFSSSKVEPRPLFSSDNEIFLPCPRHRALPRQQQLSASFRRTARRYYVFVKPQSRRKPAEPKVHTSSSSCRSHSASIPLTMLYHNFSRRSLPSSSSVSVVLYCCSSFKSRIRFHSAGYFLARS